MHGILIKGCHTILRCVDYLRVYRFGGAAGVTESCSTSGGLNIEQLDAGSYI